MSFLFYFLKKNTINEIIELTNRKEWKNKMRIIQVIYGYALLLSSVYLVTKLISLFIPNMTLIFIILIIIAGSVFRIHPHPDRPDYPFAFDLRIPYLHRN